MDKQIFIDRILETENLTDQLEDADANWLLNWGISRLDQLVSNLEDEEQAGEKVNSLMAVMRKINRIAGWRQEKDVEELAVDLSGLSGQFINAFDMEQEPSEEACRSAAKQLLSFETNQQVLPFLTRWGFRPVSRM